MFKKNEYIQHKKELEKEKKDNDKKNRIDLKYEKQRVKSEKKHIDKKNRINLKYEKQRVKSEKKYRKKLLRLNEGNIYLTAILLCSIGIIVYILSYIIGANSDWYVVYLKAVIDDISKIIITIAIGSCLLEWFGFVEYVRRRIRDVIIDDDFISTLTEEKKMSVKAKLEQSLFYPNVLSDKNSLVTIVQNEIYPLLSGYYYKEYTTDVVCRIINDRIEKKIIRRIVLSKDTQEKEIIDFKSFMSPYMKGNDLNSVQKDVELRKVAISYGDNEMLNRTKDYKIEWRENKEASDEYRYSYCIDGTALDLANDQDITIEIEVVTRVDIDDFVYIQRVNRPCKDFKINFHYDSDQCNVDGNAFGFMTQGHHNKLIYNNIENCLSVRFADWILPGDGICFYIVKK